MPLRGKCVSKAKPELRVRRTRKYLWDALIGLTTEKGYHAVTVKNITDRAMVNRVTFYRHYEDKHDLLMRGMDEIFEDLIARTKPPLSSQGVSLDRPAPNARAFFQHVREYGAFYRVMLGRNGVSGVESRIRKHIDELFQERLELARQSRVGIVREAVVPPDLAISSISAIVLSMMRWWLESNFPVDAEEIALYATRLIVLGPYRALGVELPAIEQA